MNKLDILFIQYMDSLYLSFKSDALEQIEKLLLDIPKQYEKGKLSIDHFIALMNTGRTMTRMMKEH